MATRGRGARAFAAAATYRGGCVSMSRIGWILFAVVTLVLSAYLLALGMHLLPPAADMQSKLKTIAPLIITWGMIWIGALIGIALVGILVATAMREARDA
jgi:hypothetical protein